MDEETVKARTHLLLMMSTREKYAYACSLFRSYRARRMAVPWARLALYIPETILRRAQVSSIPREAYEPHTARLHLRDWSKERAAVDFWFVKSQVRKTARTFYAIWPAGAERAGLPD